TKLRAELGQANAAIKKAEGKLARIKKVNNSFRNDDVSQKTQRAIEAANGEIEKARASAESIENAIHSHTSDIATIDLALREMGGKGMRGEAARPTDDSSPPQAKKPRVPPQLKPVRKPASKPPDSDK
ncbi:MAG: hypothetical protein ACREJM_07160, partial [Candidatus Saccharimonadales bacterium]